MSSPFSSIKPVNVGIIGCGNIFPAYVNGCRMFRILNLTSCADLNEDAARARAAEFQLTAKTIDEIVHDPEIEIVINLTVPKVHARVGMELLRAGKHVYSEKPLATDFRKATELLELATEKNLRAGCAPDTFLGAGLQTSRKLLDDGWIGRPIAGSAFFLAAGPESWHPNPGFFYRRGGGPMLDMGPYYVTALVHLLGPVGQVCAMTSCSRSERLATSKEHFGEMLPVEIPTHCSGSLLFENGAIVTMGISFDVQKHSHKPIEIYGSDGSLSVPDPNTFGGPVSLFREGGWKDIPSAFHYGENSRGIGVADMAHAIRSGRPHRCDARLALHALEVMEAFETSHNNRAWVDIKSSCPRPMPLPMGLPPGLLDS